MKQLIDSVRVLTFNERWEEIENGYIWIIDDRIIDVGNDEVKREQYLHQADRVYNLQGQWVMPGLINAHSHLFQTFMRGLGDDKPLLKWLKEEIYPLSALMEEEDFYLSALLGCVENLKKWGD
jgi:5-methylthioadenosine/S-adenosylhomocysteine deaminase